MMITKLTYPFIDGSSPILYNGDIVSLFADIAVNTDEYRSKVTLTNVNNSIATFVVGTEIIELVVPTTTKYGDQLSVTTGNTVIRAIAGEDVNLVKEKLTIPTGLQVLPALVEANYRGVTSINQLKGVVGLYEGSNISLTPVGDSIVIAVGANTVVDDIEAIKHNYVTSINGVKATDSNITITSENCYRIIPNTFINTVDLINDCTPGCSCDDYAESLASVQMMLDSSVLVNTSVKETVAEYNTLVGRYNTEYVPKFKTINLTMASTESLATKKDSNGTSKVDKSGYVNVTIGVSTHNIAAAGVSLLLQTTKDYAIIGGSAVIKNTTISTNIINPDTSDSMVNIGSTTHGDVVLVTCTVAPRHGKNRAGRLVATVSWTDLQTGSKQTKKKDITWGAIK